MFAAKYDAQRQLYKEEIAALKSQISERERIIENLRTEVIEEQEKTAEVLVKMENTVREVREEREKTEEVRAMVLREIGSLAVFSFLAMP